MKRSNSGVLVLAISLGLAAWFFRGQSAFAHEPSKSFLSLTLDSDRFTCQVDIPLADLSKVVALGADQTGLINGQRIEAQYPQITAYILSHLQFVVDGQIVVPHFIPSEPVLEEFSGGQYLHFDFSLEHLPQPKTLELKYDLFFQTNSFHRGLARVEANGKTRVASFSPAHPSHLFRLATPTVGSQFFVFVREGVWHIWTGYDHILFLLALLLPSVLQGDAGGWRAAAAFRPAFFNVLKIVTAFTVAHSLTLSLATLGIVQIPTRLTESAIALSVLLAAANNLWPLVRERGWMVAFGFGLIHGFGFATALSNLGLGQGAMAVTLIGFNLGVELGQLAIVAIFLPTAFALRGTWVYRVPFLRLGSASISLIAAAWCVERALNVSFMPF
jgi:hypothetical protein